MRYIWKIICNWFSAPSKSQEDWVGFVRTRNGGLKLEYSSDEALYKHYKRQFDAAAELHKLLKEGKLNDK